MPWVFFGSHILLGIKECASNQISIPELEPLRSLPSQQFNEEVSVFAYTYRGLLKFLTRDELSSKEILSI